MDEVRVSELSKNIAQDIHFRSATMDDLDALVELEETSFDIDRMNRRSFRWMIQKGNCDLIVALIDETIVAYILVLYHRGTHLARIYSLAVSPAMRGRHIGGHLLQYGELLAVKHDSIYMRLEVHPNNTNAIRLYEQNGYHRFGYFKDYYEDHADALRYQKRILHPELGPDFRPVPYYQQTTDFSCGPASLMMAMKALQSDMSLDRRLELQLWREATTIFMTSGHGGCSPLGLALAAWKRHFKVEVYVNSRQPLFLDGVRSEEKKAVMTLVHEDFIQQVNAADIKVHYRDISIKTLQEKLKQGGIPIVLISSYRFNRSKSPHWVVVSGADDTFIYIHDPEVDEEMHRFPTDNIYLPIAIPAFDKAFRFGQAGLRTCIILSQLQ